MPRRSSVTSLSTPKSDANERQQQALQLENELEAALTAKNDRLVNTCRMRLCEIFSDWIMSCPMTAMQVDAVGRLWKLCFYGRIGPARAKLLKAKRKHKDETTAIIVQQQERLQAFLAEGVTLLDFLCDKLLGQLSQSVADNTQEKTNKKKTKINTKGIVPCLHRLYIHLGDLFRYGSHYKKALTAYERAAQLAPAQGHAYNQLAVTTQVQDTSEERRAVAITVYWYVRSLAAQNEPFLTAKTNLQRLLQQNRQWLQQQQVSTTATMTTNTIVLAGQISRSFLASFCDLQYDFLFPFEEQQQQNNIAERTMHAATLLQQLLDSSALGESLLFKLVAIAAFSQWHGASDSNSNPQKSQNHECARTATLAWGTCLAERVATVLQSKQNKSNNNQQLNTNIRGLGPLLVLTEFVLNYNKNGEVAAESESFWQAIIRVYNLLHSMTGGSDAITDTTALPLFPEYRRWQGFAPFASFVIAPPPQNPYTVSSEHATNITINDNDTEYAYIADDEAVKVLVQHDQPNNTRQQQQQSTQQSGSIHSNSQRSSANGSNNSSASLLRVKRFLCLPLAEMVPRIQHCTTESRNYLEWNVYSTGTIARNDHADVVDTDGDAFMDDDHDMDVISKNDNLLVYQRNEFGGPVLLVPGALMLQNQEQEQIPSSTYGAAASVTLPSHLGPALQSLLPRDSAAGTTAPIPIVPLPAANTVGPTVLPPPGFGQALPLPLSIGTDLGHFTHAEALAGGRVPSILEALLVRNDTETASFASGPPVVAASHGASNRINTLDDNKHIYSLFSHETTTANPFAPLNCSSNNTAASSSSLVVDDFTIWGNNNNYPHCYQHDSAFLGSDAVMEGEEGGMTLLDSGLLNSLLFENHSVGNVAEGSSASHQHNGNSATTKNPFAT